MCLCGQVYIGNCVKGTFITSSGRFSLSKVQ